MGCMLVALLAVVGATRQPWLGLVLTPPAASEAADLRVVSARGPSERVPVGSTLIAIAAEGGPAIALEPTDAIDEPDYFDEYADMDRFFGRQSALLGVLRSPRVALELRLEDGTRTSMIVAPAARRPLSALSGVFWFQISAGIVGLLVSLWVLVLRPRDAAVRMFALAGAMILGFSAPAAVYSTRELAIDGTLFRVLSGLNHLDANLFGVGLVGIFLMFPRQLVRPRALWVLPGIIVPWVILDVARVAPNQTWGSRVSIMLEMLLAIVSAIVQWWGAKGDARARASLRWFGVCVLTGASAFVFSVVGTVLFGVFPPIPQGYSFGFFLMMHVGLALGLRRTRLFELNELAYAVLFWVVGALALIGVDAALLFLLETSQLLSSALALFVVGVAYLPVRSWLWSKAIQRRTVDEDMLFRSVLDVVFAVDPDEGARRYLALFEQLFSPLEIELAEDVRAVTLKDDGLRMELPPVASLPALRLAFPWRGRGLFGERHAKLTTMVQKLAEHAEQARDAFDRGVREERGRVARDLHDNVGAVLTTALYLRDVDDVQESVRSAMLEMRSMVNQLNGWRPRLTDLVGDLRREALQRLVAAKATAEWPLADFGAVTVHPAVARSYTSMMREALSNVVRHAGARTVTVQIARVGDRLVTTCTDDGCGFDVEAPPEGNGLRNLRRRAAEVGGSIQWTRGASGVSVRIELPLDVPRAGEPASVSPPHGRRPPVCSD
jgi:signal transduction histidine kinase